MLKNLGAGEITIIGILLLVFFGSKKLNEFARGLGEATKEARKAKSEYQKVVGGDTSDLDNKGGDRQ